MTLSSTFVLLYNFLGEPGLKTLWCGIGVLHHLLEGAQLAASA